MLSFECSRENHYPFFSLYIYIYIFHETHLRILQKIVLETADFLFFFSYQNKTFRKEDFRWEQTPLTFRDRNSFRKAKSCSSPWDKTRKGSFFKIKEKNEIYYSVEDSQ